MSSEIVMDDSGREAGGACETTRLRSQAALAGAG